MFFFPFQKKFLKIIFIFTLIPLLYAIPKESKNIDKLIKKNLLKKGMTLSPLATDTTFLKRVYLVVAGRIPHYKEAKRFLNSTDNLKREKLIKKLLKSEDYVNSFYNFWADLLAIKPVDFGGKMGDYRKNFFDQWMKKMIREDQSYRKIVEKIISAEGDIFNNPQTYYFIQDDRKNMLLEKTGMMAQSFLGTRIGCAQCHDHKSDKWTQEQFYQNAAFFSGLTFKNYNTRQVRTVRRNLGKIEKSISKKERKKIRRFLRTLEGNYLIKENKKNNLKYPDNYIYDKGKQGKVVSHKVLFGRLRENPEETKRENYAAWLTSAYNRRFTKTIVNRLWREVMGQGFFEPVDDLKDNNLVFNRPLFDYLERLMRRKNYKIKSFLSILLNSKAFQMDSKIFDKEDYQGEGYVFRRMTPYQIWDSLELIRLGKSVFNIPVKDKIVSVEEDLKRTSFIRKTLETWKVDFNLAYKNIEQNEESFQKLTKTANDYFNFSKRKKGENIRFIFYPSSYISYFPYRLKQGNFLKEFGMTDRESVSHCSIEPSIPQSLFLMNSFYVNKLVLNARTLRVSFEGLGSLKEVLDFVYLSVLSRFPLDEEMRIWQEHYKGKFNKNKHYKQILWTVINSREFIFIQ